MAKPALSAAAQRGERKLPPSPKAAPWLVFSHGNDGKFQTFYDMSECEDPLKKKSANKFIPELSKKRFWQKPSHQGWVITVVGRYDDPNFNFGDCFLWNPESLGTVMLPNIEPFVNPVPNFLMDCVLTSPPLPTSSSTTTSSRSARGDESMVFFLFRGHAGSDFIIYCRPGDKEWRKHEFVDKSFRPRSMFYLKGKLFITGMCGKLIEIAIQHGCSDIDDVYEEILRVSESIDTRNNFTSVTVAGRLGYVRQSIIMECFGEVFRIDRFYIPRGDYKSLTNIVIAKLDFASMAWEEVNSLNDYVLFLSSDSQLCCLASELGLTKGCVYFTQLGEISLYKYDLEDKSVLHCLPCPDLPTPWSSSAWLMITATPRYASYPAATAVSTAVIKATETGTSVDKDANKEEARPSFIDNDDMVRLISHQLHTVDYTHFRAVSRKYRSMLNLRRPSSNTIMRTADLSPWLVFVNYDQHVYNFVTPMHNNENYLMNIPEVLKGFTVRFSKDGWLLMSKDMTLFFYNPFSKSTVRLPDLPDGCSFAGISFSSLPTSSDCMVFGIDKFTRDEVSIVFIKRGDTEWTSLNYKNKLEFEPNFNNPVFHRGAFYCLDLNGSLGVFKFENDETSWEILAMVPRPNCEFIYKSFLVECEGNLLCVLLGRLGKWVRVFRLNKNEMVWIEVKHLGRNMLFISHTSSISAVAPTRQMENKIYFPRLHADGILFYSLDTGLYHCLGCEHSAKDYGNSKEYLICSWIEPNCLETTSGQCLDWCNI